MKSVLDEFGFIRERDSSLMWGEGKEGPKMNRTLLNG